MNRETPRMLRNIELEKKVTVITHVPSFSEDRAQEYNELNALNEKYYELLDKLSDAEYLAYGTPDLNDYGFTVAEKIIIAEELSLAFVMSPINERDKYSDLYSNCVGGYIRGINNQGKSVSMLIHANPEKIMRIGHQLWLKALDSMISRCAREMKNGTISGAVFGGRRGNDQNKLNIDNHLQIVTDMYDRMLFLGAEQPNLISPKIETGAENVVAQTNLNTLHIFRLTTNPDSLNLLQESLEEYLNNMLLHRRSRNTR